MKRNILFLTFVIIGLITSSTMFGQTPGDFQSVQSGNWGDLTTWQTWDGSGWIAAASTPDNSTNAEVTVLSPNNVTIAASVSIRNVTVNTGATLTVNGNLIIVTVTDEGMIVNGNLTIAGTCPATAPYTLTVTAPAVLTIGGTGVVNYNQSGANNALPVATWLTGSTLNVNGVTSATSFKAGGGQNFYNLNWNCTGHTANFGMSFLNNTINGTVRITNTNTGRLQFFGSNSGTLNILGDFIISGSSNATVNGTSSASNDTINVYGKVNVNTTGNFSISRGSQGGVGTSIFNFYGDSVKIIAGTMPNSNTTPNGAKFIFKKTGVQYLTFTPTVVSGNAIPIEIASGANVYLLSPVNVTTLYLNGGIITSSVSNPLIMGWWTGSTLTSGTVSGTAPGSATSYINGPISFLYATAAGSFSRTYPIGKDGIFRPVTLSLTQTDATLSRYTVEMFNAAPPVNTLPGTLDGVSINRYYTISETIGGSAFTSGSLLLNYNTDDGVTNEANLRIAQGPAAGGGAWVDLGGTGTTVTTGSITSTTSFADLTNTIFTLANNTGGTNILPVELSSFTALTNDRNVTLKWVTKTEVNSNNFVVERSLVGTVKLNWTPVGTIQASGNSNSPKNYYFNEKGLQTGRYQYRLKMIDKDGSYKYSDITETEVALPKNFALNQNYPNPFNPSTKITYSLSSDSKVTLEVYSISGERVAQLVNEDQSAGYYTINFGSSLSEKNLSSGIYFYRIVALNKLTGNNNFSSIKKMILIK